MRKTLRDTIEGAVGLGLVGALCLSGINGCTTPQGRVFERKITDIATQTIIQEGIKKKMGHRDYRKQEENQYRHATGKINRVWVDHNTYQNGEKGMRIHTKFIIKNNINSPTKLVAYFYHENKKELRDKDGINTTSDGQVSAWSETLRPDYENTIYRDVDIFMPYDQLDISQRGKHQLKFHVDLIDFSQNPRRLSRSSWNSFWFKKQ